MGREFELKYAADPARQESLLATGGFHTIRMETTYYDTPDRALSARRITLRLRMENGEAVCTVKTPADGGARGEWECRCDDIEKAVPELCRLGAPALVEALTRGGVEPICGARFTRHAKMETAPGCRVELAVDAGVLLGGGREAPLCEVEVEVKEGSDQAACLYAAELAEAYGLTPEPRSKFRRALALAQEDSHGRT